MTQATEPHVSKYDKIKCNCCGHPWDSHPSTCCRHDFRPGSPNAIAAECARFAAEESDKVWREDRVRRRFMEAMGVVGDPVSGVAKDIPWLSNNPLALAAVLEGLEQARNGELVPGPDLDADAMKIEDDPAPEPLLQGTVVHTVRIVEGCRPVYTVRHPSCPESVAVSSRDQTCDHEGTTA